MRESRNRKWHRNRYQRRRGNESKHIKIETGRKPGEIEVWDVGQTQ
jgi:hypothetical protein